MGRATGQGASASATTGRKSGGEVSAPQSMEPVEAAVLEAKENNEPTRVEEADDRIITNVLATPNGNPIVEFVRERTPDDPPYQDAPQESPADVQANKHFRLKANKRWAGPDPKKQKQAADALTKYEEEMKQQAAAY